MYAIMNKDLNAYSHGPTSENLSTEYERLKRAILDPNHWMYGSKLVSLKRVKSGIEFKVRISWKHLYFKPRISWSYGQYFEWAILGVYFNFTYCNVPDRIINDHIAHQRVLKNHGIEY